MKAFEIDCAHCGHHFVVRYHRKRRLVAAGAGVLVGAIVTDGFVGAIVFGGLTYMAAAAIDSYWSRRCPHCDTVAAVPTTPAEVQPAEAAEASIH